jgi:hypothetical protein
MSKEDYNEIIDEVYNKYDELFDAYYPTFSAPYPKRLTKEELVQEIKNGEEIRDEFQLDIKITERELTLEERYDKWFNNNYETGMERYFNPNNLPDFDNEYYHPTPTKQITLTYNNETIQYYE